MSETNQPIEDSVHQEELSESQEEIVALQQIEADILTIEPELLSRLDAPERKRLVAGIISVVTKRTTSIYQKFHSGPLPSPQTLKEYGSVVESAPERIIQQFELQADHRRKMEDKVISAQLGESKTGQWMGFILGLLFLGVSAGLILTGHEVSGTVLGTIDLVSLVALFVIGRKVQKEDLEEKDQD